MELFNVTDALITLKIPSTNQITRNQKWRQRVCKIIRTGGIVNSLCNSLLIQELNNSPLTPSSHELLGNLPNLVCSICSVWRQEIVNFMTSTPRGGNSVVKSVKFMYL